MTEPLFTVPPKLPRNQQLAYDHIAGEGATAADVGHMIHLNREPRCKWCVLGPCNYSEQTGRDVLKGLRRKGLAVRRKNGLWQQVGTKPARTTAGPTDDIPY